MSYPGNDEDLLAPHTFISTDVLPKQANQTGKRDFLNFIMTQERDMHREIRNEMQKNRTRQEVERQFRLKELGNIPLDQSFEVDDLMNKNRFLPDSAYAGRINQYGVRGDRGSGGFAPGLGVSEQNASSLVEDRLNKPRSNLQIIDSSHRDKDLYPDANNFRISLPRSYRNVKRVRLVSMEFPNVEQVIKETPPNQRNNIIRWLNDEDSSEDYDILVYEAFLTPGNYSADTLATEIETRMNLVNRFSDGTPHEFSVSINLDTDIVTFQSIQSKLLVTNPLSTVINTNVITVSQIGQPFSVGDQAVIQNARTFAGIPSELLNTTHIVTFASANSYEFIVPARASQTVTAGGGTSVRSGVEKPFQLLWSNIDSPGEMLGFPQEDSADHIAYEITFIDVAPIDLTQPVGTLPTDPNYRYPAGTVTARLTSANHRLTVGDQILLQNTNCIPSLDGLRTVLAVINADEFEVSELNDQTVGQIVKLVNGQDVFENTRLGTGIESSDTTISNITSITIASQNLIETAGVVDHNLSLNDNVYFAYTNTVSDMNVATTVSEVVTTESFRIPINVNEVTPTGSEAFVKMASAVTYQITDIAAESNGEITAGIMTVIPTDVYIYGTDTTTDQAANSINGIDQIGLGATPSNAALTVNNYNAVNGRFDLTPDEILTITNPNGGVISLKNNNPVTDIFNVIQVQKANNGIITTSTNHEIDVSTPNVYIYGSNASPSTINAYHVGIFPTYTTDYDADEFGSPIVITGTGNVGNLVASSDPTTTTIQELWSAADSLLIDAANPVFASGESYVYIRNSSIAALTTTFHNIGDRYLNAFELTTVIPTPLAAAPITTEYILTRALNANFGVNGNTFFQDGATSVTVSAATGTYVEFTTVGQDHFLSTGNRVYFSTASTTSPTNIADTIQQVVEISPTVFRVTGSDFSTTTVAAAQPQNWFLISNAMTSFRTPSAISAQYFGTLVQSNSHGLTGAEDIFIDKTTSILDQTLWSNVLLSVANVAPSTTNFFSFLFPSIGASLNITNPAGAFLITADSSKGVKTISSTIRSSTGIFEVSPASGLNIGENVFIEFVPSIGVTPSTINQTIAQITDVLDPGTGSLLELNVTLTSTLVGGGTDYNNGEFLMVSTNDSIKVISGITPRNNGLITTSIAHGLPASPGSSKVFVANTGIAGFATTVADANNFQGSATVFETNIPITVAPVLSGTETMVKVNSTWAGLTGDSSISIAGGITRDSNGSFFGTNTLSIGDQVYMISTGTETVAEFDGVRTISYAEATFFELSGVTITSVDSSISYDISTSIIDTPVAGLVRIIASGHTFEAGDTVTIVGHSDPVMNISGQLVSNVEEGVFFSVPDPGGAVGGTGGTVSNDIDGRFFQSPVGAAEFNISDIEIGGTPNTIITAVHNFSGSPTNVYIFDTQTTPDINGINTGVTFTSSTAFNLIGVTITNIANDFFLIRTEEATWARECVRTNVARPDRFIAGATTTVITDSPRANLDPYIGFNISESRVGGSDAVIAASGHTFSVNDTIIITGHQGSVPYLQGSYIVTAVTSDTTTALTDSSTAVAPSGTQIGAPGHTFVVGDFVTISGHTGTTPDINSVYTVIAINTAPVLPVTDLDNITIDIVSTGGGTGGTATGGATLSIPVTLVTAGILGVVTGPSEDIIGHGLLTGDSVRFKYVTAESNGPEGLEEISSNVYTVTVTSSTEFTIPLETARVFPTQKTIWSSNIVGIEYNDHGLVTNDIFYLYGVKKFAEFDTLKKLNTRHGNKRFNEVTKEQEATQRTVLARSDSNFLYVTTGDLLSGPTILDFPLSYEIGGGFGVCISSKNHNESEKLLGLKNHGFNSLQENIKCNGLLNRVVSLEGDSYAILTAPQLNNVFSTGPVNNIFAKLILQDSPGSQLFNGFVVNDKEFENPIASLDELDLTVYAPNGELYNFNGLDYSFSIEILEYVDTLRSTGISSYRGIVDRGISSQLGTPETDDISGAHGGGISGIQSFSAGRNDSPFLHKKPAISSGFGNTRQLSLNPGNPISNLPTRRDPRPQPQNNRRL